jgi:ribulose-phosphate 3-epimerase
MDIIVAPSVLAADFGRLQEEVDSVVEAGADRIHFDVMDGHFVPNISFGAPVLKCMNSRGLPVDVHLMIEHPWKYYEDFVKAAKDCGPLTIIIHSEVCSDEGDLRARLQAITDLGAKAGVCIKPGTAVETISGVLDLVDQVLVMTVEPGFGGQAFMGDMLPKFRELRDLGYEGHIGADGGIGVETCDVCIEAGADVMGAGSSVFKADDRAAVIKRLRG